MIQAIKFILVLTLLLIPALWLAFHPGLLVIEWLGWRVESDLAVLILLLFLLMVLGRLLAGVVALVLARPKAWWQNWRARRGEAQAAFGIGLLLAEAGDVRGLQHAAKQTALLEDGKIKARLLEAIYAELTEQRDEAKNLYQSVTSDRILAQTAYHGLARLALAMGEKEQAVLAAEQGLALANQAPWANRMLLSLYEERHDWAALRLLLERRKNFPGLTPQALQRKRVIALLGAADEQRQLGNYKLALALASRGLARQRDFVPAIIMVTRLMIAERDYRGAERLIEKLWHKTRHAEIAAIYRAAAPNATALEHVRRFAALERRAPRDGETDLVMATICIEASLWGEARRYAERASSMGSQYRRRAEKIIQHVAQEIHSENQRPDGNGGRTKPRPSDSTRLYDRAPPDRLSAPDAWRCQACLSTASEWTSYCHQCGAVDALHWIEQ
ncbi:MAG: heme biosynthesis HemY N-terminal domain-containing protein [Candidatus Symbiobacter sp.]|nr:heme biosynthesis HemY N-terminal domain-containing protein [Candidatus Symbiobacter sp.]